MKVNQHLAVSNNYECNKTKKGMKGNLENRCHKAPCNYLANRIAVIRPVVGPPRSHRSKWWSLIRRGIHSQRTSMLWIIRITCRFNINPHMTRWTWEIVSSTSESSIPWTHISTCHTIKTSRASKDKDKRCKEWLSKIRMPSRSLNCRRTFLTQCTNITEINFILANQWLEALVVLHC